MPRSRNIGRGRKAGNTYGAYTQVDVAEVLTRRRCPLPEPKAVRGAKTTAPLCNVEYAVWMYVKEHHTAWQIAEALNYSEPCVAGWLKKLSVFRKVTPGEQLGARRRNFLRTPEFAAKCRQIYDSGVHSIEGIAAIMDCDASVVQRVADGDGWSPRFRSKKHRWVTYNHLRYEPVEDYSVYALRVRYFTQRMRQRYGAVIDPDGLLELGYELDHRLSVYEGFHRGAYQVPWQLLCHPANLAVVTHDANRAKGRHSDFGPVTLARRIRQFERRYGQVFIPAVSSMGE